MFIKLFGDDLFLLLHLITVGISNVPEAKTEASFINLRLELIINLSF